MGQVISVNRCERESVEDGQPDVSVGEKRRKRGVEVYGESEAGEGTSEISPDSSFRSAECHQIGCS